MAMATRYRTAKATGVERGGFMGKDHREIPCRPSLGLLSSIWSLGYFSPAVWRCWGDRSTCDLDRYRCLVLLQHGEK